MRTLGIDVSTQSISGVIIDVSPGGADARVVAEHTLPYRDDARLSRFGFEPQTLLIPPRIPGEADQPPRMFLAGLDALLGDLVSRGVDLGSIAAISVSAQQHGHVYLNSRFREAVAALGAGGSRRHNTPPPDLATRLADVFAYGAAPIWQTADSREAADEIRAAVGGRDAVVRRSGSDSPARFTAAVMRRTARRYPEAWRETVRVHLLSSFISAVLSANPDCPIDWGNGSGMTLMDYEQRTWSPELIAAVESGVAPGVAERLPPLASPIAVAGRVADYFVARYGFSPECLVNAGSGDNPQSKVMTDGDLLSLGTSFVYMVDTGTPTVDLQGYANSMYDGIGRPFVFACRTNGAMVWDRLRSGYAASYEQAEAALSAAAERRVGGREAGAPEPEPVIWQPYAESYPVAPPIDHPACREATGDFAALYPALVDSALVLTRHYARGFEVSPGESGSDRVRPLAITGGPSRSPGIVARVAAIFARPVVVVPQSGAALGSALSAWETWCAHHGAESGLPAARTALAPGRRVEPDPSLVAAYRRSAESIVEAYCNHPDPRNSG